MLPHCGLAVRGGHSAGPAFLIHYRKRAQSGDLCARQGAANRRAAVSPPFYSDATPTMRRQSGSENMRTLILKGVNHLNFESQIQRERLCREPKNHCACSPRRQGATWFRRAEGCADHARGVGIRRRRRRGDETIVRVVAPTAPITVRHSGMVVADSSPVRPTDICPQINCDGVALMTPGHRGGHSFRCLECGYQFPDYGEVRDTLPFRFLPPDHPRMRGWDELEREEERRITKGGWPR